MGDAAMPRHLTFLRIDVCAAAAYGLFLILGHHFWRGFMARKSITRRDFLNGTLIGSGTLMMGGTALNALLRAAEAQAAEVEAAPMTTSGPYYPPRWTGMRGSHPGAFERAHELAREGREDWGGVTETGEAYDLIVVGGGASGLAAAYFFQQSA